MTRPGLLWLMLVALPLAGCLEGAGTDEQAAPGGQIDGAVVDQLLNPFPNATVFLGDTGRTDRTSALGGFTFHDVPPGTYTLHVLPEGTQGAHQSVTVVAGEVSRTILQVQRPWSPPPYMAALGHRSAGGVVLAGDACEECGWTARLHERPVEVDLHAAWAPLVDGSHPTLRFLLRDDAGRVLLDETGHDGELWVPLPGELMAADTKALHLEVRCGENAPCVGFEVSSHLDVYYGADREQLG